jgi:hypothetical protein
VAEFFDEGELPILTWSVEKCLSAAMYWAKVPWEFFVLEWLRTAHEMGPVDFDEETRIRAVLYQQMQKGKK